MTLKHGYGPGDGIVLLLVYSSEIKNQWEPVCGDRFDDVDAREYGFFSFYFILSFIFTNVIMREVHLCACVIASMCESMHVSLCLCV